MQHRAFSDRYQLEERLEASYGVDLYRARDNSFPRNVCVTVFSNCDTSTVESFRSRAQSLAGLSHHHIMSIYDMECEGDSCYLISEYRECLTLREEIDMGHRFSLEEALFMAMNIAKAIAHAHNQHVVHGQLSSDMIWMQGGDIKVAFVCPRTMQEWMATQEQEDLFALGKMFKELFSATPPLYKPEVRVKVKEVIDRLTGERQPAYADASDVAYDLKMILTKDANPLYMNQLQDEDEQTRPFQITQAEIQTLLGNQDKSRIQSPFNKIRAMFLSYFTVSVGMLFLGLVASFFLVSPQAGTPSRLTTSIENGPVSVAKAETTDVSSTITISPKEPISKAGKGEELMPDLVGLKADEAEKLLLSLGLRYVYYLERSDAPVGTVFKQVQEPNHPYQPGDRVVFFISNGQ